MAYLGLFTIIFTSCFMGSLASSDLSTVEDEGRFLFGTGSTTGTTATGSTDVTITGWETTAIVGVIFVIALIAWVVLLFLPSETAATAYAATAYETDPYAAHEFAAHTAPSGFQQTGHHAQPATGLHSSYSVVRSLEAAARKYL